MCSALPSLLRSSWVRRSAAMANLLCCLLLLLMDAGLANNAALFCLPVLAGSALLWLRGPSAKAEAPHRSVCLLSAGFTLLFLVQLPLYTLLQAGFFRQGGLACLVLRVLLLPLLTAGTYCLLLWLFSRSLQPASLKKAHPVRQYWIAPAFCALLFLLGRWPAKIDVDTLTIWDEALRGHYSDWHTIGYSILIRLVQLSGRPWLLSCAQVLLFLCIVWLALDALQAFCPNTAASNLYTVACCLLVPGLSMLANLLKDTPYCLGLFGMTVYILRRLGGRQSVIDLPVFLVSALGVALCRHGGQFVALVCIGFLIVWELFSHRPFFADAAVFLAVVLICHLVINTLGFGVLQAEENKTYVSYSTPLYLAAAVVAAEKPLDEESVLFLESIMPLADWKQGYSPFCSDSISKEWGVIGLNISKVNDPAVQKALLRLNLKFLCHYPLTMFHAFFCLSSLLWEMSSPGAAPAGQVYNTNADLSSSTEWTQAVFAHSDSAANRLTEYLSIFLHDAPVLGDLLYRGGIWLFTGLMTLALLLYKRQFAFLPALMPTTLVSALLFLSIPAQYSRYVLYLFYCAPFLLAFALFLPSLRKVTPGIP